MTNWVPVIYNVRSLAARRVTTTVTVAGLALAVFIFATVLMLAAGAERTLVATGDPMNAKVIRKGAGSEVNSDLDPEQVRVLSSAPEVASDETGHALASPELSVLVYLPHRGAADDSDGANVGVRGVGRGARDLHALEDLDGRQFTPGKSEIVIGRALAGRFQGAELGQTMTFAGRSWTVVGVADHGGTAFDSEIWGDLDQLVQAFQRRPVSVTLRLKDPGTLPAMAARMAADPRLKLLEIQPETAYWRAQSEDFALYVTIVGVLVAVIFSLAAVLGAMITMYGQVTARTREIGALRAIGFRPRALLVSFVVESVLLSLVAGCLGIAGASLMQYAHLQTTNWQTYSEISFGFHLTPAIVAASLGFAALMGYAGGLLPALRSARMPIVRALRGG